MTRRNGISPRRAADFWRGPVRRAHRRRGDRRWRACASRCGRHPAHTADSIVLRPRRCGADRGHRAGPGIRRSSNNEDGSLADYLESIPQRSCADWVSAPCAGPDMAPTWSTWKRLAAGYLPCPSAAGCWSRSGSLRYALLGDDGLTTRQVVEHVYVDVDVGAVGRRR